MAGALCFSGFHEVGSLGRREEERLSRLMTLGEQNENCEVTDWVGCYRWSLGLTAWQEGRCWLRQTCASCLWNGASGISRAHLVPSVD